MAYANCPTAPSASLFRLKPETDAQPFSSSNADVGFGDLIVLGMTSSSLVIFVYTGYDASQVTGTSIVISIVISGLIAVLSALCYAEFASRLPKVQGSAYSYTYIAAGEFLAFIIGWSLIMEYIIGAATCTSAITQYINTLSSGKMQQDFMSVFGEIKVPGMSPYVNFIALFLTIICGFYVGSGLRILLFIDIMFIMSLATIVFVISCGSFYDEPFNWRSTSVVFSRGFNGVIVAAANLFYAFIGMDVMATASAEINNNITGQLPYLLPFVVLLTLLSMTVTSAIIVSMYTVTNLNVAAISQVFIERGIPLTNLIIIPGVIAGLLAGAVCSFFALIRITVAMAKDGLILPIFGKLNSNTRTPIVTVSISTMIAAILSMLLSTETLINMTSVGTLLACTMVAICVIISRYRPSTDLEIVYNSGEMEIGDATVNQEIESDNESEIFDQPVETTELTRQQSNHSIKATDDARHSSTFSFRHSDFQNDRSKRLPTHATNGVVNSLIACYFFLLIPFDAILIYAYPYLAAAAWWTIVLLLILASILLAAAILIVKQPKTSKKIDFMTPLVPYLPLLAIFCNVFLMLTLPIVAWIRFAIWLLIGLPMYFFYGMRNSWQGQLVYEPAERSVQLQD